jgi:hypothetical protein
MSLAEMKKVINEKVEGLNETQLKEVEIFINKINNIQPVEWDLTKSVNDIVKEREEVLKKLAK